MCNGLHESHRPVCVFQLSVSYLNTAPSLDRADVPKGLAELFFKQVKSWRETKGTHPPPTIVSSLITRVLLSYIPLPLYSSARRRWRSFLYIKRNGLYFVCVTKFNVSPTFILELLSRYSLNHDSYHECIVNLLSESRAYNNTRTILRLPSGSAVYPEMLVGINVCDFV